ncbi:MAG: hypothetical protein Q8910_17510, partial [Bacteroidota bacterium]|nr:hypothetical protein [Bacteroidota bacterium]
KEIESNYNKYLEYKDYSQKRVSDNYSWEKIVDEYEYLFKKLLTDQRAQNRLIDADFGLTDKYNY